MISKPIRVQLHRTKGWKMPNNTVKVDRTTPLGNPFQVGIDGTRKHCVYLHSALMGGLLCVTCKATLEDQQAHRRAVIAALPTLRGKNLACWCPLPARGEMDICHAATLLEYANYEVNNP
jgi:hypothetical protein